MLSRRVIGFEIAKKLVFRHTIPMQNKTNGCIFLYIYIHRLDDVGFHGVPPLWRLTIPWKILFSHDFTFLLYELPSGNRVAFYLCKALEISSRRIARDDKSTGCMILEAMLIILRLYNIVTEMVCGCLWTYHLRLISSDGVTSQVFKFGRCKQSRTMVSKAEYHHHVWMPVLIWKVHERYDNFIKGE
jgi:hypothetical protein